MAQQPPGPPPGKLPPPPPGGYPPPPPPHGGSFAPQGPPGSATQPDNYLVWAILVTVLCGLGLPLGIVSIVKATQVSGLWAQGRYAEAQQAADDAKKWAIWGAIIGAIAFLLVVMLNVALTSAPPS